MPRRARLVLPGFVYHVTQRGNHRQQVFFQDSDRWLYLQFIKKYSQKYALSIYAFCLMENHVHFIVRPQTDMALAQTFQVSHQRYAFQVQRRAKLSGHLWQGRFFSCLLQENHFYEAVKYVENNPVRAKMVDKAWSYWWSSARAHAGQGASLIPLASVNELMPVPDWKEYLTRESDPNFAEAFRECTLKQQVLGTKDFIGQLEQAYSVEILPVKRGRSNERKH